MDRQRSGEAHLGLPAPQNLDAFAQRPPILLLDGEAGTEVEQDFLPDRVSCAGVVTEPVDVVGRSALGSTCVRFSDEHGALGIRKVLYGKICVPRRPGLVLIKYLYKSFYLIILIDPSDTPKRYFQGEVTGVYRSYRYQDQGDSNGYFQRVCASYFSLAVRLLIANRMSRYFGGSEDPLCDETPLGLPALPRVHSGWARHARIPRTAIRKKVHFLTA